MKNGKSICKTCGRHLDAECDEDGCCSSSPYCFYACHNFKEHKKEVNELKLMNDRRFLDWIDIEEELPARKGKKPYRVCAVGTKGNPEAIVRTRNGLIFMKKKSFAIPV